LDVGKFNGHRIYDTGLRLDYRLRLCTPKSASGAVSAVAELLVLVIVVCSELIIDGEN